MEFKESRCKGIWLHRFELVADYGGRAVKERCARCAKEVIFKLDKNGNANNFTYLRYHARQALVPMHNLFNHEYPQHG